MKKALLLVMYLGLTSAIFGTVVPDSYMAHKGLRIANDLFAIESENQTVGSGLAVGIGVTYPQSMLEIVTSANTNHKMLQFTFDETPTKKGWVFMGDQFNSNTNLTHLYIKSLEAGNSVLTIASSNVGFGNLPASNVPNARVHVWDSDGSLGFKDYGDLLVLNVGYEGLTGIDKFGYIHGDSNGETILSDKDGNELTFEVEKPTDDVYLKVNYKPSGGINSSFYIHMNSAGAKTFVIDHPDEPNRLLVHSAIETPSNDVFYTGSAVLSGGEVQINLPDYFESLTREEGRTVRLSNVNGFDRLTVKLVDGKPVKNGSFTVISNNTDSVQEFDWEVKAVRKDVDDLIIEPDKSSLSVKGLGPYRYYEQN